MDNGVIHLRLVQEKKHIPIAILTLLMGEPFTFHFLLFPFHQL